MKHKPKKHRSCAEADRAADEQIGGLAAEVERLEAEVALLRLALARPVVVTPAVIPGISVPAPSYPGIYPRVIHSVQTSDARSL